MIKLKYKKKIKNLRLNKMKEAQNKKTENMRNKDLRNKKNHNKIRIIMIILIK